MVSISKTNQKMGGIPSISFPPVTTCANCAECSKKCYAKKMARFRPSVGRAWSGNLEEWRTNPDGVRYAIMAAATVSGYFRYFVGGDIPDTAFFEMMIDIAKAVPRCEFLAFTKKYDIVNNSGRADNLPENLHVIFSNWGDQIAPNPANLPTSNVIFKGEEIPNGVKLCGGNCIDCICRGIACWQLKRGESIYFIEH